MILLRQRGGTRFPLKFDSKDGSFESADEQESDGEAQEQSFVDFKFCRRWLFRPCCCGGRGKGAGALDVGKLAPAINIADNNGQDEYAP